MIKLIADSTCDLAPDIVAAHDIAIVPLTITVDGQLYRDGLDLTADQFYSMIESLSQPATTGAPSPQDFLVAYEDAYSAGYQCILGIMMSSGTSASYQSASVAQSLFLEAHPDWSDNIYIVDSVSMSQGSGWLILKSAQLIAKGMSFKDVIKFNEIFKFSVQHFLSVDDLDHLIRSGRLGNVSAIVGKILRIKPIMSMKNKKGAIVARARGRRGVINHYVKALNERLDDYISDFVIIGYTSDRAYAENLAQSIRDRTQFAGALHIMQMGVSVGVHVGLGGLSLFFVQKIRQREGLVAHELERLRKTADSFKERFVKLLNS